MIKRSKISTDSQRNAGTCNRTSNSSGALANAFPNMALTHAVTVATDDPVNALETLAQQLKESGATLSTLTLRRYRDAGSVINLKLQCGEHCTLDDLVTEVRERANVNSVVVEHILAAASRS